MDRRQFLAALGAGVSLAGCLDGTASGTGDTTPVDDGTATATPGETTPEPTPTGTPGDSTAESGQARLATYGIPSNICEESIHSDPGIYAIVDPAFDADWSGYDVDLTYRRDRADGTLVDEQTVIGLAVDGTARAYPLSVLNTHEVVNDTLGGPVLVTFCPICRSGLVADRHVDGEATPFAVSGLLWQPERIQSVGSEERGRTFGAPASGGEEVSVRHNGNLVMYDAATRSYWSQILGRAICGPQTGTELTIRPSTVATWGEWRDRHPATEVLLPPPHSGTVDPGEILGE